MSTSIIRELAKDIKGENLKYCVTTFGCQMNFSDSDKLEDILEKIGYSKADKESEADFVLYNTCCIRENAEDKVYGNLGHLKAHKKKNPDLIIAVCGCMMQQEHVVKELKKNYRHVDIIFGTFNLFKLPQLLQTRLETGKQVIDIWDTHQEFDEYLPTSKRQSFKASINIMQGCNNFCSYCIVPYVRGRERSREMDDIIKEVKHLVSEGVTEITLLGQNVNSYGKTLDEPVSFAQLIYEINKIEGLRWIRFMTSHPKDLSDELIEVMAKCHKVCNHIHLPIQSGSNRILKLMRRRYTKEGYLELIDKIKRSIPDIAITTDIIVGFPGETEEDFQHTLDIIEKVGYQSAFTFIYSKRTGTPAAVMDNQVDKDIVTKRFNKLVKLVDETAYNKMKEYEKNTYTVLVEKQSKTNPKMLSGRTEHNVLVHFEGSPDLIGQYVDVYITKGKSYYTLGEIK